MQELQQEQEYACERECGAWFPKAAFEKILSPAVTRRVEPAAGESLRFFRCPECRHDMEHRTTTESGVNETLVHCCPDHGVWLERGSLHMLGKLVVASITR